MLRRGRATQEPQSRDTTQAMVGLLTDAEEVDGGDSPIESQSWGPYEQPCVETGEHHTGNPKHLPFLIAPPQLPDKGLGLAFYI